MGRVYFATENMIMIIPTVGFVWDDRKVWFSFAWINFGISILVFERCEKLESEG